MLLYRPLLAAFRDTPLPGVKRFLLRELADPVLHAEPDELLAALPASAEPAVQWAHVALAERALALRLTTRDPERTLGGLWTCQAAGRALVDRARATIAGPVLVHAGGALLAPIAAAAVQRTTGAGRARVLAALGCCGPEAGLALLADELAQGPSPAAAAVGLALAKPAGADTVLFRAVQARGLGACGGWIGTALRAMAGAETLPVLGRLTASGDDALCEQAALALEGFAPAEALEALGAFPADASPLVRLNLLASLGRLRLPGGTGTLARLTRPDDPAILRVTALRACGGSADPEVRAWVTAALERPDAQDRSAALESLVLMGTDAPALAAAGRRAAAAAGGRELLFGLLGLAVSAPEEALARIRGLLAGTALDGWFLATYALRYVRTPAAVPLLKQILEVARGTGLEEVAAGALGRHLDEPEGVQLVLAELARGPLPATAERLLADLARHLPEAEVPEVAAALRDRLEAHPAPELVGPLLEALGSLGGERDLDILRAHVDGPAGPRAIHAMEMLMDPAARPQLAEISRGRDDLAQAARVARFRLGDLDAAGELADSTAVDPRDAPRPLFELGLTLRCLPNVSRLALLHRALVKGAGAVPPPASARRVALAALLAPAAAPGLEMVLSQPRLAGRAADLPPAPAATPAPPAPALRLPAARPTRSASAAPAGDALYADLGQAWLGRGLPGGVDLRRLGALALGLFVIGFFVMRLRSGPAPVDSPTTPASAHAALLPAVLSAGGAPVRAGATLPGSTAAPLVIATRLPENTLVLRGSVRVVAAEEDPAAPRNARLELELFTGGLSLNFPRGRSTVTVRAARTAVECMHARADLELAGDELVITTYQGLARVPPTWEVRAGQRGRFRDGRPTSPIETLDRLPPRPELAGGSRK